MRCNAASARRAWCSPSTICSPVTRRPRARRSARRSPETSAAAPGTSRSWRLLIPLRERMRSGSQRWTPRIEKGAAMPVHVKAHEVLDGENVLQVRGGSMSTKMVYGNDCNMMLATRAPGYHSNPHRHDCEQINYVLEGEVWVFLENDAFLMKKGDFSRIPRNALHWAWNRGDKDCVLIEVHAPGLRPAEPQECRRALRRGRDARTFRARSRLSMHRRQPHRAREADLRGRSLGAFPSPENAPRQHWGKGS